MNELTDCIFDTKILFGDRENEIYEIICRGILDIMYDKKGFAHMLKE